MKKGILAVIIIDALLISLLIYFCYRFMVENNIIERIRSGVSVPAGSSKIKTGRQADGDYDKETAAIAQLITPDREDEFIEKALSEIRAGRLKEALKYYDAVVKANPENKRVWSNRAYVKTSLGDYAGAVKDASVSIEINPERYTAYLNRMAAYYKLGEWQKALDDIDAYIEAGKFNEKDRNTKAEVYSAKGELLARLGRYDKAAETLLYIEPECAEDKDKSYVYGWLGWSYKMSGNAEKAEEYYEAAKRLKS